MIHQTVDPKVHEIDQNNQKIVKELLVFKNGNVAVFDENDQQITELQKNLLCLWCEFAEGLGYNLDETMVKISDLTLKKGEF